MLGPSIQKCSPRQFSVKCMFIFVTCIALILSLYTFVSIKRASIYNGYYQWDAGLMVLEHLELTGGEWPRNWDCLEARFDRFYKTSNRLSFREFKQRVFIDFSVSQEELQRLAIANDEPMFDVIHSRYGARLYPVGDANQLIYDYFRKAENEEGPEEKVSGTDIIERQ